MPTIKKASLKFNFTASQDTSITKVEMGYKVGEGEPVVSEVGMTGNVTEVVVQLPVQDIANQAITYWSTAYSSDGKKTSTTFTQVMPDFVDPIPPEPAGIAIIGVFDEEVPEGPPSDGGENGGENPPVSARRRGR